MRRDAYSERCMVCLFSLHTRLCSQGNSLRACDDNSAACDTYLFIPIVRVQYALTYVSKQRYTIRNKYFCAYCSTQSRDKERERFEPSRENVTLKKYFCKSQYDSTCAVRQRNKFTDDLVLTVHSLDRAFQITWRTHHGVCTCTVCECARTHVRRCYVLTQHQVIACRCGERIVYSCAAVLFHVQIRRSFSVPSLRALLSNMPGMPLPNMPSAK